MNRVIGQGMLQDHSNDGGSSYKLMSMKMEHHNVKNGEERGGGWRAVIELREHCHDTMTHHILCNNCQRKSAKFQIHERSE